MESDWGTLLPLVNAIIVDMPIILRIRAACFKRHVCLVMCIFPYLILKYAGFPRFYVQSSLRVAIQSGFNINDGCKSRENSLEFLFIFLDVCVMSTTSI